MTFKDIIRDSPTGELLRLIAPRLLPYPEDFPGFTYSSPDSDRGSDEKEYPGEKGSIGTELCDWYGNKDPENPKNWSLAKKLWVTANILACAFVVYMSGPIWSPSHEMFAEEFGTGYEYTSLGLALYTYVFDTHLSLQNTTAEAQVTDLAMGSDHYCSPL